MNVVVFAIFANETACQLIDAGMQNSETFMIFGKYSF